MTTDKRILEALDLTTLTTPSGLQVQKLEVDEYTDWSGDPALRIQILLDESTDIDNMGEQIDDLKRAIHRSLQQHGIPLFPYVFLVKPSELAEARTEAGNED